MSAHSSVIGELPSRLIRDGDGTGRYMVRRLLGEGTSGRVYHVTDMVQRREVALKTLKALQPDEVYRLKREFRSLLDVTHPNLVHLHELVVRSEVAYFTMELIEGSHLLRWIWDERSPTSGAGLDSTQLGRLRAAFCQLVPAVHSLHSLARIHRDIKPSNVVVARDGRVVLVDLGLCVDLRAAKCEQSMEGQLAGTVQYMSPEQARGQLLTPASDWFSLGVLLFEALTGELPFDGLMGGLMLNGAAEELGARLCRAPSDLAELTCRLLQGDPRARPAATEILRCMPASRVTPLAVPVQLRAGVFFGREAEVQRLRQALQGSASRGVRIVTVSGEAGVGKTCLVDRVSSWLEADGALVLRARCHYREKVPYKGVDGLVDNLSRFLSACDSAKVAMSLPHRLQELLETFPTLRRVPGLSDLESSDPPELPADEAAQPNAVTRHRAFIALRELINSIAEQQQVMMWVDDLQWVDRDSLVVLQTLAASRHARNLSLVLSYRSGVAAHEDVALRLIHDIPPGRVTRLDLLPLDDAAMRRLVLALVPSMTEGQLHEVIQAAQGSPFVAREICRDVLSESSMNRLTKTNGRALMERLLVAKLDKVPEHASTLFGVICVAGFPMDERLLARLDVGQDVQSTIGLLVNRGLLRYVVERGQAVLDVGHDALRDAFLRHSARKRIEAYQKLSALIAEDELVDPFQKVEFVARAGDRRAAAQLAYEAAERAETRAAFHLAAALFQRYLNLADAPDYNARARLGQALCEAGRVREGALELIRAADGMDQDERQRVQATRLRAIAGERLLARANQVDEGLRVMNQALSAFNIRYMQSVTGALVWLLFNLPRVLLVKLAWRVRGWLGRKGAPETGSEELQLQVLWSAGAAVAQLEPIHAAQFHARHALRAYRTGSEEHIALSLCVDAVIAAMLGGARRCRRSLELRAKAQRLAARCQSQYALGFIETQTAAQHYFMGRWRDTAKLADRAVSTCRRERLGMASQITLARFLGQMARAYQGRVLEVRSRTPDLLVELDALDDWTATACMRLGWVNMAAWLCWGEVAEAEHQLQRTDQLLETDKFNSVNYLHLLASTNLALYKGEARLAWEHVVRQWPRVKRSHQLRLTIPRYELIEARGRAAAALASQTKDAKERQRLLREVERSIKQLQAIPLPFGLAASLTLGACRARLMGDERRVHEQLHCASLEYSSCGMDMHAAACALLLKQQRNGPPCLGAAEQWFKEQEIAAPERVVATLIPFPEVPSGARGDDRSASGRSPTP